jgi:hypothetical protein
MPLNKLHVPDTLPTQVCAAINAALHASLVEACGANPDDDFCLVARYAAADRFLHPTFLGERDASRTIIIEIALLEGRSEGQKESLYRMVRQRLAALGIEPRNVILFLIENRPIDWSFGEAGSVKAALGL